MINMINRIALLLVLAWRNLWRNPWRTMITLVVVAIGAWSVFTFTAMLKAWAESSRVASLRLLTGEGQIHAPNYMDDPSVTHRMPWPSGELLRVLESSALSAWTPRVRLPAVIQSEYRTRSITLLGIVPSQERAVSDLPEQVSAGRYLSDENEAGVVLGEDLVTKLKTRIGKRVIVLAQAADGRLAERSFQVIGTFDASQAAEVEFVFAGQRPIQSMLGLGDDISEIAIDVGDDRSLPTVISALKAAAPALDIRPWMELSPLSYTIESISETVVGIWLAIMFVLIAIGIVNTQLMAVFERTREFGLLQALGMRARLVLAQVAVESALLAGTGVIIGAALSMVTVFALEDGIDLGPFAEAAERYGAGRIFYPKIILADYAGLTIWLWVLAIVAALWPAYAASRISPVEAMSHA